jgi:hypothetical protein
MMAGQPPAVPARPPAATAQPPDLTTQRPAILGATLRREVGWSLAAALPVAAAVGGLAAWYAAAALDAGGLVVDRLVRRFDLTALGAAAVLALLRIPTRVEHDQRDGWLAMFVAAGASRISYIAGVAAGAFMTSASLFCVVAVAFASGAYVLTDSTELVMVLPVTIATGLLLLASWSAWSGLAAVLLRRALPAFFAAIAAAMVPHILVAMRLMRSEEPTPALIRVARSVPPLLPHSGIAVIAWQLAALSITAAAAALAARRLIGRHV